jgi:hypothetical protein
VSESLALSEAASSSATNSRISFWKKAVRHLSLEPKPFPNRKSPRMITVLESVYIYIVVNL